MKALNTEKEHKLHEMKKTVEEPSGKQDNASDRYVYSQITEKKVYIT